MSTIPHPEGLPDLADAWPGGEPPAPVWLEVRREALPEAAEVRRRIEACRGWSGWVCLASQAVAFDELGGLPDDQGPVLSAELCDGAGRALHARQGAEGWDLFEYRELVPGQEGTRPGGALPAFRVRRSVASSRPAAPGATWWMRYSEYWAAYRGAPGRSAAGTGSDAEAASQAIAGAVLQPLAAVFAGFVLEKTGGGARSHGPGDHAGGAGEGRR